MTLHHSRQEHSERGCPWRDSGIIFTPSVSRHQVCTQLQGMSPCLQGFRLIFTFSENPYFSNRELVKTYYMVDEEDPVLEKPEGTQIQWKEGKDPTIKVGAAGTGKTGRCLGMLSSI